MLGKIILPCLDLALGTNLVMCCHASTDVLGKIILLCLDLAWEPTCHMLICQACLDLALGTDLSCAYVSCGCCLS